MNFKTFGKEGAEAILLIPGLGVSYEIFLPLIGQLEREYHIIAVEVDGFCMHRYTEFSSVDDQARQVIQYLQEYFQGKIELAYGLSLGGKILSRVLERQEVSIEHAIMDAAPLLPLPKWLIGPLKYLQAGNVWTGFWRWLFHSHYFDVLLDECRKVFPYGGTKAVLDGYQSVYSTKLESIAGKDIHYWYGSQEAFVAKAQAKHLLQLHPDTHIELFKGLNHGQLLVDRPEEVATRIIHILSTQTSQQ